jgi:hypothetical protein
MGIFDLFKRKEKDNRENHSFDSEDRELSLKLRRQRAELKTLELQRESELQRLEYERKKFQLMDELDELKGVYEEVSEEEPSNNSDNMLMTLLASILAKKEVSPPLIQPPTTSEINLSDEQIKSYIASIPKVALKIGKSWNDEQLTNFILSNMPNLNKDSINRIITILRNS